MSIAEVVYECPDIYRTKDACIKAFAEGIGMEWIHVPDDGNCFYHTLQRFFRDVWKL